MLLMIIGLDLIIATAVIAALIVLEALASIIDPRDRLVPTLGL